MRLWWLTVLTIALSGAVVLDTLEVNPPAVCDCAEDLESSDETDDDAVIEAEHASKRGGGRRMQTAEAGHEALYVTGIDRPPCA
jgi:hypothetical protein